MQINNSTGIQAVIIKYLAYQKALNELEAAKQKNNKKTAVLKKDYSEVKVNLDSLKREQIELEEKIGGIMNDISDLKSKFNNVNRDITDALLSDKEMLTSSKRAEDSTSPFNIMIEYNGKIHKILEHCSLLGHAHPISQGGQPIKEHYNFIARRIN